MVDALCRARRWVTPPDGRIIDLRPADVVAKVETGMPDGSTIIIGGLTVDGERRARHAAADAALREVLARGVLTMKDEEQFWFFRYPDSLDELRDYIATKWQHTRLDQTTYRRAAQVLRANAAARLCLRERVAIRTLMPTDAG